MKKSIFLFFAAILCSMSINAAVPSKLYLDASGWGYADARYAAYFMPQNSFVDMTKAPGEVSVFEVAVPASQTKVIFVRMNGGTTANNWDNKWNQTGDLTIPTDGKNKFKPSGWDGATTTWSTYTYTPPTLYIAGDFVTPNWDPAAAANKMDYADGVYSKSYNDVAASAHQFKITNGGWDGAIGYNQNTCSGTNCKVENKDGNIQFTPLAEGTVTITYTLADGKVHITCPEPPAAEFNITYPATQTNYTLVAGPAKAQTGAEVSFTATPAEGYVLNVTYNGNVIAGENNVYTFMMPAADVTIAITAVAATTLYYVDHNNWGNVNAYMWSDHGNNGWPGAVMALVGTVGDNAYSYYSISFAQGAYTSIIFNGGGSQTADLTIDTAKPYFYDGKWYTWDELLAKLAAPVVTYDYYLTGSLVGGWDVKQQGIEKDGELYKATFLELGAGIYEFKITAGDWDHQWNYNNLGAAYEEVSQGVNDEGNPNGNIKIVTEEAINLTVIFDATAGKITFEGLTLYVVPLTYTVTVPAGTEKCYIAGAFAQSNWNTFVEMTKVGDEDKFTIEIVGAKETDEYKYACQADWAYAEVIDGGGNRTNWSELDEVTAWGKPVIVTYELKGVGGWEQPGIELVQNPDPEKASEYMLTCQAISATDAIKVVRLENGEIKDYYGNGTVKDGVQVTVEYDDQANIKLPAGTYNFYFDTAEPEKKLWIAEATDCVEYTDLTMTNLVVTPMEGFDLLEASESTYGISVTLGVDAEGNLIEGSNVTFNGETELPIQYEQSGKITKSTDEELGDVYSGIVVVTFGEDLMSLRLKMYSKSIEVTEINITGGTVALNAEGAYSITANLDGEDVNVSVPALEFEEEWVTILIGEQILSGTASATNVDGTVTLTAEGLEQWNDEWTEIIAIYNITITATVNIPEVTVYFINTPKWNAPIYAYAFTKSVWGRYETIIAENAPAPGLSATKTDYQIAGYDVYSYTTYEGLYSSVQFSAEENATEAAAWESNMYYIHNFEGNSDWYTREEAEALLTPKTPDYTRTVTSGNYGTICLPFGGTVEGAELFECVGQETGKVYIASVTELQAGVPYIFLATGTELAVYSDGTTAATPGENNGLVGTFTDATEVTVGNYILFNNAICEVTATCWVNANRAYIVWGDIPAGAPQQMPGRKYISMDVQGENETTGIEDLFTTEAPAKVIENGQLIIIREGVKYNVQGQKL